MQKAALCVYQDHDETEAVKSLQNHQESSVAAEKEMKLGHSGTTSKHSTKGWTAEN
jgi:hypothetical protein